MGFENDHKIAESITVSMLKLLASYLGELLYLIEAVLRYGRVEWPM